MALHEPESHLLPSRPDTVHWGFFDAALRPVLRVRPGDSVTIETVNGQPRDVTGCPFPLLPDHAAIHASCSPALGPHILTGPVAIDSAEPGDVLEVRILEIELRQDWGWNAMRPLRGSLPEDFAETRLLHIPIDRQRGVATLPFGPEIALSPFFGIMGVAPESAYGAVSSIEPRHYGGNIDITELGAGARIFLPVQVPSALFSVGDGHAVQGDGEVNLTALETALTGRFEFHLHKSIPLRGPIGLSADHLITMGFSDDLDDAAKAALRAMIGLLSATQGWSAADAYAFCSLACDLRVSQLVNGNKGIHAMVRRSLIKPVEIEALRHGSSPVNAHPGH